MNKSKTTRKRSNRARRLRKQHRGFTLVEIMITVTIMTVVGSIGLWGMESLQRGRYQDPLEQIQSALILARSTAASEKRDVQVNFNNAAKRITIWVDRNEDGDIDAGEWDLHSLNMPDSNLIASPQSGSFKPDGSFSSSGRLMYISINTPQGIKALYVMPAGHVKEL